MTKLKKGGVGDSCGGFVVSGEDAGKFIPPPAKVDRIEGRGSTLEGMEGVGGVKGLGEGPIPAPLRGGSDLDIHDLVLSVAVVVVCLSFMCVFNAPSDP
jgi:hypothetical protein